MRRFSQSLKGELDWIVMKAIEKDRRRRYNSPNDIQYPLRRYRRNTATDAANAAKLDSDREREKSNVQRLLAEDAVVVAEAESRAHDELLQRPRWNRKVAIQILGKEAAEILKARPE